MRLGGQSLLNGAPLPLAVAPNSSKATLAFRFTRQGIYEKAFNATLNATVVIRAGAQPQPDADVEARMPLFWTPIHQISPLNGNWPVLTFDLHNESARRTAIDTVVTTGMAACTDIIQARERTLFHSFRNPLPRHLLSRSCHFPQKPCSNET